ncbi:MAG: HAD family hydrolase [Candidatus Hydrogenedentes bacterium]|nr:HAD family hydrolase [Candidatus Hydrogenedentota bacterium]
MHISQFQAVLFDLDETLLENTRSFQDMAYDTYFQFRTDLDPVSADDFWQVFWSKAVDMWYMMIDGVITGDEARLYTFVNTLRALDADSGLAKPMLEDSHARIVNATRLFEDTIPVLTRLREAGLRLGIVTNGYATTQHGKIARHSLRPHVDFVVVSEEVGSHKPDPAIFGAAVSLAQSAPARTLFVGDTFVNDIEGALGAGLRGVLVDPSGRMASGPSFQGESVPSVRCLAELLPILGLE